jgi:hypothetical protein
MKSVYYLAVVQAPRNDNSTRCLTTRAWDAPLNPFNCEGGLSSSRSGHLNVPSAPNDDLSRRHYCVEFGSVFFTPIPPTAQHFCVLVPWRSELLCAVIKVPSPPLNLLKQSWYICQHIGELGISQLSKTVLEEECFVYQSPWSRVCVEYQQCITRPVTNWRLNGFQWRAVTRIFTPN